MELGGKWRQDKTLALAESWLLLLLHLLLGEDKFLCWMKEILLQLVIEHSIIQNYQVLREYILL